MRAVGALVAGTILAITACGGTPRMHSLVLPGPDRLEPLAVEVDDRAGIVAAVLPNGADRPPLEPVAALPGDPAAVAVTWAGGACDTGATLTITRDAAGFRIAAATRTRGGACRLLGIHRSLVLRLVEPIPAEAFSFREVP